MPPLNSSQQHSMKKKEKEGAFVKEYVLAENEVECVVQEAGGGGNCFYRSIQVLLGNNPNDYMVLKEMVYEYAKSHKRLTSSVGHSGRIEARIIEDGRRARYQDIFITANFLRRDIHLYLRPYPNG